jgi:hypothetical protein
VFVLTEQELQTQEGSDPLVERLFEDDRIQPWAHAKNGPAKVAGL